MKWQGSLLRKDTVEPSGGEMEMTAIWRTTSRDSYQYQSPIL